jgi:hypothetical protein
MHWPVLRVTGRAGARASLEQMQEAHSRQFWGRKTMNERIISHHI